MGLFSIMEDVLRYFSFEEPSIEPFLRFHASLSSANDFRIASNFGSDGMCK